MLKDLVGNSNHYCEFEVEWKDGESLSEFFFVLKGN